MLLNSGKSAAERTLLGIQCTINKHEIIVTYFDMIEQDP